MLLAKSLLPFLLLLLCWKSLAQQAPPQRGLLGVNWGTQLSHPLYAPDVVNMLKGNHFSRVKLFEAEPSILRALAGSNLEVMVGIPNDMLQMMASSSDAADKWVRMNVSRYRGTHELCYLLLLLQIRCGWKRTILAGLQRVLRSRDTPRALNADVLESSNQLPSGAMFRSDIQYLMLSIVQALASTGSPFTINLYPFISLHQDPNFPIEYAFLDGNMQVQDGPYIYTSVFDVNFDMLVSTLQKAGFPNMDVIIGEAGWPTEGDINANPVNAKRFNQALVKRIFSTKGGTPLRPGAPLHVYIFSLIDEDLKSIAPGPFERHWGIFTYDGQPKYPLDTIATEQELPDPNVQLERVKNVEYLPARWCILQPDKPVPQDQIDFACGEADCTPLVPYGGSCGFIPRETAASYAFNSYYQLKDQNGTSCYFQGNAIVTGNDPTTSGCRFIRQIKVKSAALRRESSVLAAVVIALTILAGMY